MGNFERGSEWRHTATSFDYKYKAGDSDEKLCEELKNRK